MAKLTLSGWGISEDGSGADPYKLSSPLVFFWSMMIFLILSGFVAAILYRQIQTAFLANPGLNGLILGVLRRRRAPGLYPCPPVASGSALGQFAARHRRCGESRPRPGAAGADAGLDRPPPVDGPVDHLAQVDSRFHRDTA